MRALPVTSGQVAVPSQGLVIRTRHVPDDDPISRAGLLELLPHRETVAWIRDAEGMVGWGEAARAEFTGSERFSRAMSWWHEWLGSVEVRDEVQVPGSGPLLFGSFAFDTAPGRSVVVVPQVVYGRSGKQMWVTTAGDAGYDLPPRTPPTPPVAVRWREGPRREQRWAAAVERAVARIDAGELDKVVLARDLIAQVDGPIDERFLMERLHLDYPHCWTFHVAGLVGATPELLVHREGTRVASRVLAGTALRSPGSSGPGSDAAAAAALLASEKDLTEHAYAVASVADALATHCTGLRVPQRPQVLRLANVLHLSTDVQGTLADGASALALAASLHPTAAVCGTPTERARNLIRSVEGLDRGRYAGPVGWVDRNGDGEFGIALRCGEIDQQRGTVRIFAGCGLVTGSTPEAELTESAAKFAAMRSALAPTS